MQLLSVVLSRPHEFSVSELARLANLSKASVSNIVAEWERTGVVLSRQQGKNKLVSINSKFYLLPELRRVYEKTRDYQKPLLKKLDALKVLNRPSIKAVVVFGSRMRNDFSHASDLDVLIVVGKKDDPITEQISESFVKVSDETGVRFSPVFMGTDDVQSRRKEKDQFIQNILAEGKIVKGAKWFEHLQATP